MSAAEKIERTSISDLQPSRLLAFERTFYGILSTRLAELTFAQIIDGLPTRDDIGYLPTYSAEIRDNSAPSPEAMEAAMVLQGHLDTYITNISIDAKLSKAYQDSLPESREFYMRLLVMLAVACHDIAGLIYIDNQPGLRRQGQSSEQRIAALEGRPTDFMHEDYHDWEQYPNGIADVVGYWAE